VKGSQNRSPEGISLALTSGQVAQVVEAASGGERPQLLFGPEGIRALIASPLFDNPKISKSLLLGLLILVSFPSDGSERGNNEIAQELGLAASTTHRYLHTLVVAGLLEQNPVTRQYLRSVMSGCRGRGRRG
jgi:hypothetical protein